MLNDVAEHIQRERYSCFPKLKRSHHDGSIVYTPHPHYRPSSPDRVFGKRSTASLRYHGHGLGRVQLITFERSGNGLWQHGFPGLPRIVVRDVKCMCSISGPSIIRIVFSSDVSRSPWLLS
jgi:hypothetical protein